MIEIGKVNTLLIERTTSVGLYLSDEMNSEVLLPKKYILPEHVVGDNIDVFIYKDSEDRLIATTDKPFCEVGQFTHLNIHIQHKMCLQAFRVFVLYKALVNLFLNPNLKMLLL